MKEVERSGRVAMRRCLQELERTEDVATRTALWRCAGKYLRKEQAREGLEFPTSRPFVAGGVGE